MSEEFSPAAFEHQILEADIKRLSREIHGHREKSEVKNLSEREVLKKSIQSLTPAAQISSAEPTQKSGSPLPAYAKSAPAETKLEIEYLLDLAFHKGIEKANAEAKKSSPFVLDAFHDALVAKLYPELQKRGILK